MRKCIAILLCVCALTATASASDMFDYSIEEWKVVYGVPEPQREDYEDSDTYSIAWNMWNNGFCDFIIQQTQAEYARISSIWLA